MRNKRGDIMSIIWIVSILFVILLIGLLLAFGSMTINWVFDEAVPELSNLGMVGSANLTEVAGYTLAPVNNVVQSFTWLTGVIYILGLVGCLGLAFAFRFTGSKWLMGFFFACMFLLIVTSIFISNIYEEFYSDGGDVGSMLHEQVLMSWLILYSPMVMCIVGFISGIIMFTGEGEEGTA